ncbi:cobyric acid synthase [Halohasta salina]|uniref:cobyric acid synthase n=1 Tax=Halohasta salina TaxID=2961621 RepID=UPI0020A3E642|nr:cobyric acid synthase [Halohasta salina]
MARTILVAGTASHVGKSTVAAGLCRLLADRGVSVAPFKAQNMSNNARAVPRSTAHAAGDPYGEIGVSQYVQARAAGVAASTDHNPVLLKPRGSGESQLVVDGQAVGHFEAGSYYEDHWETAREAAEAAHDRLAADREMIIAEGAGSIAEINLQHRDLANVETARFADAEIVLVADIERGGVFASLVGTLELMPDDLRGQVRGVIITKFRGDLSLLESGLREFENRTGVDVLGVLPYDDPGLPEEDSLALPAVDERATVGDDDGVDAARTVTVGVPRLPRASNMTDLEPLAAEAGVRVEYLPLSADLGGVDAVVIPGTKNTVDDLLAIQEAGLDDRLRTFDGPVVGLCGGYQMLGERIHRADIEGTDLPEGTSTLSGLGLLPVETTFSEDKRVVEATLDLDGVGPFAGAEGPVDGYEIHMGDTESTAPVGTPFARDGESTAALGACRGDVVGCYLHGLFENGGLRDAFLRSVYDTAGRRRPERAGADASPYDRAAALVADHCAVDWLESDG